MALISCDFFSESLQIETSMTVILPPAANRPEKFKTLWLLHGYNGDNTSWHRNTAIERYVSDTGIAVVMPDGNKSFYTDMVYGMPYWTFFSEELPHIAQSYFPLSSKREDNSVAGLSMGGYGAFKLAFSHPERYCSAGSFSGALDLPSGLGQAVDDRDWKAIFGENPVIMDTKNDLKWLLKQSMKKGRKLPALYQCCGTKDFLYDSNLSFKNYLNHLSASFTYEEDAGYEHTWEYWDLKIQHYLKWLKTEGFYN